jgi:TRAP transporter TAXI family solute receptor
MKRLNYLISVMFLIMILLNAFSLTSMAAPKITYLLITTATTGGTYYPIGVGLSTLWTEKLKQEGIRVSAQSSAGSGENISMLKNKEAELAILQGLFGSMAWQGKGMYEGKPYKELRSITMLWPNTEHFVLTKGKVITGNVLDMKGTRFSIGRAGSGTERSTLTVMQGVGLSKEDISPEYLGYMESAAAIKDGKLDGASLVAGPPVAAVSDLAASPTKIQILEFTDEQIEGIGKLYPIWFRYVIPAGTYMGQDKDIQSIAQPNWLGVRMDIDEDVIYQLTKTIFENLEYLVGVHKAARFIQLDAALSGLPVPLHSGALKYYREQGLKIPDSLIPPEAK